LVEHGRIGEARAELGKRGGAGAGGNHREIGYGESGRPQRLTLLMLVRQTDRGLDAVKGQVQNGREVRGPDEIGVVHREHTFGSVFAHTLCDLLRRVAGAVDDRTEPPQQPCRLCRIRVRAVNDPDEAAKTVRGSCDRQRCE
jgi:hypothetical protein